jgi:hypothetical protein
MGDSLSPMSQRLRPEHTLKPREGRRTPLNLSSEAILRKGAWPCIDRSTRNSAEVYTSHKIAILDDASSKLILGRLPTRNGTTLSLRTGAMLEYHRHAETVRHSTWPLSTMLSWEGVGPRARTSLHYLLTSQ